MGTEGNVPVFEEENEGKAEQQQLMAMMDKYGKPDAETELKVGARVKGTVSRIGDDAVYVDLNGKRSAVMKKAELTKADGTLSVNVGDTVEAFVGSMEGGSVMLTQKLSVGGVDKVQLRTAMEERLPVQGKVTGINKGGLQVRVLGTIGFCPASQIEMKYVEDLNPFLGKSMTFVIMRMEGKRVVLSRIPLLEQEAAAGIDELAKEVEKKTVRRGKIMRIADFGLFVDTGTAVDGLVHISEVSWARTENLKEQFQVGQEIEYVVLGVERKEPLRMSKISLSLKQALADPWTTAAGKYAVGAQMDGVITRCAPFGAFVQLEPGIEGLIHISELTWDPKVRKPEDVVKPGQPVRVTILSCDTTARRIGCSYKNSEADPWKDVPQRFPLNAVVKGKVTSKQKYGFFVDLADMVSGLLAIPNIAQDKRTSIKVGDEIEVTIVGLDIERRRISLAFGMESAHADSKAAEEYHKQVEAAKAAQPAVAASGSEFGDALKAALEKKK